LLQATMTKAPDGFLRLKQRGGGHKKATAKQKKKRRLDDDDDEGRFIRVYAWIEDSDLKATYKKDGLKTLLKKWVGLRVFAPAEGQRQPL
jgi:hypothetical protein